MGDGFAQLASVSAVLGGFTVTFLAVVLTLADERRRVGVAVAVSTAAAVCFFACALGWSLFATVYNTAAATGATQAEVAAHFARIKYLHSRLSLAFILGLAMLFVTLGVGGWLRSRALGWVTTGLALAGAAAAFAILREFVSVSVTRG